MPATSFQLTEEQRLVIEAPVSHYVVTAVAGSGKTTTLAHRIRYLLMQGYDARRMLVLMFNRSAKDDFQRKLGQILDSGVYPPEIRTFHAMGYRLYQRFVQEGYLSSFHTNILSEKEIHFQLWRLMNQFMSADQLKEAKRNKKDYIEAGYSFIEAVKNSLSAPNILFEELQLSSKFRFVIELFGHFEQWRKDQRRITYTDMLYEPVCAIQANPQLLTLVANKMDVILVDEYQDTNDLQHTLLKMIAGERAKVTIVGDPDQTIYEFRGAKPEYIIDGFSSEFDGARLLSLSYSFRYGHQVSLLANHLIRHNQQRLPVLCISHQSTPTTLVTKHHCQNETSEICESLTASQFPFDKTAILGRVWSQLAAVELGLTQYKIPYRIEGNRSVFSSEETRSLQAILELAAGEFSSMRPAERQERFRLLLKFPHAGISETAAQIIAQNLGAATSNWGPVLRQALTDDLHKIQKIKLERLADALSYLESRQDNLKRTLHTYLTVTDLFEGIRSLSLSHDHAEEKIALVKSIYHYLISQRSEVQEALDFLRQLCSLHLEQDARKDKLGVLLTTIHRAKGLEWDQVILPGIKDKTLPYYFKDDLNKSELESERRLLYVAMTRAKQRLLLFFPTTKSPTSALPSPFERELMLENSLTFGKWFSNLEEDSMPEMQATNTIADYARKSGLVPEEQLKQLAGQATSSKNERNHSSAEGSTPIWRASRVAHTLLGVGRVENETGNAFSVVFEDKQERLFSKAHAEQFFTVIEP